ncbi:hypothetical protein D3C78_826760 [compost metagenome]
MGRVAAYQRRTERVETVLGTLVQRMATVSRADIDHQGLGAIDIQQRHVRLVVEAAKLGLQLRRVFRTRVSRHHAGEYPGIGATRRTV